MSSPGISKYQNFLNVSEQINLGSKTTLFNSLKLGGITGFVVIIGYAISLRQFELKFLFIILIIALASFISGFFLGNLFGIPKRINSQESDYNLSNNLIDISDWFTKIIIGLGLIEIKRIPGMLEGIGSYVQENTAGENSVKVVAICSVIYFGIFGLYFGYNYMRLLLSSQYKEADDTLLDTKKKELDKIDLNPVNLEEGSSVNTEKLKEYNELLKTTKKEDEYDFNDWYYKGIAAYEALDYNKAIVYMSNAISKDNKHPNVPSAHIYSGISYEKLRLFEDAIKETDKAKIFTNYEHRNLAYYNNSIYYGHLKKYDKALEEINQALQLKADDALAYSQKGFTLLNLGRAGEAKEFVEKALSLDPKLANSWYDRAVISAIEGQKEEMLVNLKKAIEIKPDLRNSVLTDSNFKNILQDESVKEKILSL